MVWQFPRSKRQTIDIYSFTRSFIIHTQANDKRFVVFVFSFILFDLTQNSEQVIRGSKTAPEHN